jgi:hypothetical protein
MIGDDFSASNLITKSLHIGLITFTTKDRHIRQLTLLAQFALEKQIVVLQQQMG